MELDSKLSELFQGCMNSNSQGGNFPSTCVSHGISDECNVIFTVARGLWSKSKTDESALQMRSNNTSKCLQTSHTFYPEKTYESETQVEMKQKAIKTFDSSCVNSAMTATDIWGPHVADQHSLWNSVHGFKKSWTSTASEHNDSGSNITDKCSKRIVSPEATARFRDLQLQSTSVDNGTAVWNKSLSNQKHNTVSPATLQWNMQRDHSLSTGTQFNHQVNARKTSQQVEYAASIISTIAMCYV